MKTTLISDLCVMAEIKALTPKYLLSGQMGVRKILMKLLMHKLSDSYRKPRQLSKEQREAAKKRLAKIKKFKMVGKNIDIRRSNDYNNTSVNGGISWTILRSKKHQINGGFL